jgi:hypothetical protein
MNAQRTRRRATCGAALATAALVLAACGATGSNAPTTTTVKPVATCPLTGEPAPNGVPQRPAIAFKVDNYGLGPAPNNARPQSGLDFADIVFEEQVEGSITRYAAVFQCHAAPGLVGDIRSARQIDIGILSELDSPLLVHVGGIAPVINNINRSSLVNIDLGVHSSAQVNPPGRIPPYDDFTTTAAIWKMEPRRNLPPPPVFTFSTTYAGGRPTTGVHLDWSYTSDIYWRWSKATGTWLRFYNVNSGNGATVLQADTLANGVQNQAQNVVVQVVHITYGPWFENFEGGLEAQAKIADSSGTAYVFRNGRMTKGTWTHGALTSPTIFRDTSGHVIPLAPGRTWVELYPDVKAVVPTYPPAASHG